MQNRLSDFPQTYSRTVRSCARQARIASRNAGSTVRALTGPIPFNSRASATVNGKDVTMSEGNAIVPLTVVNNPGFDLPKTGGYGVWMYTVGGVLLLGAATFIVIRSRKHKGER